ncbi:AAA family ATPase [Planomicrobium sp. CPCC 101079]|uniref:ATP-binding protein n=1 Tax=Planomicrobium sp. CPCC 101079 TaxID=2599618 RepID=UPI0011B72922|nr:AAA family ATPase [Planomicrobium sp. CPCC 101079]TWT11157.1 AAA family ATPase [Planomicrobium sp. CPCC 101079]
MKIEKLIIYGFGKHENRTIDVSPQLSLFYGPNEAGKTTIQQFIIQTLFGYPMRNQTKTRYEPKSGGKYGGQLQLVDEKYGRVIVERVKGKAAGDVTVFFEDGTRGGEAELKMILRDYDRAAFESIFSFSIHELQGLERMTEEELSRTLLASGTTGIDAITKMESRLEKDMGLLFKKAGRNPEMNLLIEELRENEKELRNFRSETELYGPYLERIHEIENRLADMTEEEKQISSSMREAEKHLQSLPLLEKSAMLTKELKELEGAGGFPADGRRRMERLQDRMTETASKIDYVNNELAALRGSEEGLHDTETLEQLLNRESEWHQLQMLHRQKKDEMTKLLDDQERLVGLVGMPAEAALQSDVSLNREEQLIFHVEQLDMEEEEKRFTARQLSEEKSVMENARKQVGALLEHRPTDRERQEAEQWPAISMRLAEAKAAKRLERSADSRMLSFFFLGLGLLGLLFGMIQGNYAVAGIAFLAAAAGAWAIMKNGQPAKRDSGHEKLLQKYAGRETEMDALVQRVNEFDRKLEDAQLRFAAAKEKIALLSQTALGQPAKEAYEQFLEQLGIDPRSNRSTVLDLFEKLREIQAVHSRLGRLEQDVAVLARQISEWLEQAEAILTRPLSPAGLYAELRSEYAIRQKQKAEALKREEKRAELKAEAKKTAAFLEQVEKEKHLLLQEAAAADENAFYKVADDAAKKEALLHELAPIRSQLSVLGHAELPAGLNKEELSGFLAHQETKLTELKNERNELLAELADKQQTTQKLLSNGEYEEKLQQFEEKKAEFAALAKSWAINKAIIEAIKQTMDELKEKKLPAVIADAETYFSKLTAQAYSGLEMNPAGFFEAVRTDGMRFHIAELSQATKEQAYIALRLALAVSMQQSHPFPIVMDDAFVHFDRSRLQQMINLITELQANHQFIYFTCHETMQQVWPNAHVIHVANTERSVHS